MDVVADDCNVFAGEGEKRGHRADIGNACNPVTPDASEGKAIRHFRYRPWAAARGDALRRRYRPESP